MDEQNNPLSGPGPSAPGPMQEAEGPDVGGSDSHPLIDSLEAQHEQTKAQVGKIAQAQKQMNLLRKGLDTVTKRGPAVTADDVTEEMGKLVAGGLPAEGLIALMAGDPEAKPPKPPMPEGGPGLQAWLQSLEQGLAPHEQAVDQAHSAAQHQLGQAATKVLLVHHLADQARTKFRKSASAPAPMGPSVPSNPLTP